MLLANKRRKRRKSYFVTGGCHKGGTAEKLCIAKNEKKRKKSEKKHIFLPLARSKETKKKNAPRSLAPFPPKPKSKTKKTTNENLDLYIYDHVNPPIHVSHPPLVKKNTDRLKKKKKRRFQRQGKTKRLFIRRMCVSMRDSPEPVKQVDTSAPHNNSTQSIRDILPPDSLMHSLLELVSGPPDPLAGIVDGTLAADEDSDVVEATADDGSENGRAPRPVDPETVLPEFRPVA